MSVLQTVYSTYPSSLDLTQELLSFAIYLSVAFIQTLGRGFGGYVVVFKGLVLANK